MKNKKLFAILTLLCFMFTLMPVAAFAADVTYSVGTVKVEGGICAEVVASEKVTFEDLELELYSGSTLLTTMTLAKTYKDIDTISGVFYTDASKHETSWKQTDWVATTDVVPTAIIAYVDGEEVAKCAVNISNSDWAEIAGVVDTATAGNVDAETSSFEAVDGDQTVKLDKKVKFDLALRNAKENSALGTVYIWAETANGTVTSALNGLADEVANLDNVYKYEATKADTVLELSFSRTGEYTVYAAPAATVDAVKDLNKFDCDFSVITVKTAAADPDTYQASYNDATAIEAGETFVASLSVTPNNVASAKQFVNFYDVDGKPLKGKTVTIETNSSSIEINKESDVTNSQGQIDFKVSASVEGEYEVILSIDGVEWTLIVKVGNTSATYIETANQPTAPQALYGNLGNKVRFAITDINGNVVEGPAYDEGMDGIANNAAGNDALDIIAGSYVVLTEAPADSDLESTDLGLAWDTDKEQWKLTGVTNMDAEGTYAVKVILDNGAYATATWEVKKFQKPVALRIDYYTKTVELGATISPSQIVYVDANGVEKQATDATFAASGYAIADLDGRKITVKTDEKYVGATIDVTAVSEKYDLVATATLTVADGATAVAFVNKVADVNVNNKLVWNVVDSTGTKVALKDLTKADIKYVVLDKPADAKVSVNDATNTTDLKNKGEGKVALTSSKVGNVTVQVIVKATYGVTSEEETVQTKYYTGTQIIAVGTQGVGDVVVMSIGSNEIVINDAKATIDAAPIVENNRTFVPFRALAEAFGATVAYDEATQAVTAELNGVTVVMTIGSAEYTVNGEAKTADVAPFINGSRTMVPVRFAAEAFGIKVIPTYDENGATADILFNL